jgi:hypothetical protein
MIDESSLLQGSGVFRSSVVSGQHSADDLHRILLSARERLPPDSVDTERSFVFALLYGIARQKFKYAQASGHLAREAASVFHRIQDLHPMKELACAIVCCAAHCSEIDIAVDLYRQTFANGPSSSSSSSSSSSFSSSSIDGDTKQMQIECLLQIFGAAERCDDDALADVAWQWALDLPGTCDRRLVQMALRLRHFDEVRRWVANRCDDGDSGVHAALIDAAVRGGRVDYVQATAPLECAGGVALLLGAWLNRADDVVDDDDTIGVDALLERYADIAAAAADLVDHELAFRVMATRDALANTADGADALWRWTERHDDEPPLYSDDAFEIFARVCLARAPASVLFEWVERASQEDIAMSTTTRKLLMRAIDAPLQRAQLAQLIGMDAALLPEMMWAAAEMMDGAMAELLWRAFAGDASDDDRRDARLATIAFCSNVVRYHRDAHGSMAVHAHRLLEESMADVYGSHAATGGGHPDVMHALIDYHTNASLAGDTRNVQVDKAMTIVDRCIADDVGLLDDTYRLLFNRLVDLGHFDKLAFLWTALKPAHRQYLFDSL